MSVPPNSVFAVITGGGTSGHVVPALAIAELLAEAGHPFDSIHYVGSSRGIETSLLPPTGIASTFLRVDGLQRSVKLRAVFRNLRAPFVLAAARFAAKRLLKVLNPRVVISVGGYASVPACSAAHSLGIPVSCCFLRPQARLGFTNAVSILRCQCCRVFAEHFT